MTGPRVSPVIEAKLPLAGISFNDPAQKLGVKSYTIESDYTKSTDAFQIEVASTVPVKLWGLEIQPITISINGNPVITGRIDQSVITDNISAMYSGRDYMADLVECGVDPSLKLSPGLTIRDAIVLAAGPVGITSVASADEVALINIRSGASLGNAPRPRAMEEKLENNKPDPGKGIYAYLQQICVRLGCTMQPNPTDRTMVVVSEPDYIQSAAYTVQRSLSPDASAKNNIITASANRNLSRFPTHCLVTAKAKPAKKNKFGKPIGKSKPAAFVSDDFNATVFKDQADVEALTMRGRIKPGEPGATDGKLYRLFYMKDDKAKNQTQLENKQLRLLADRLKETLLYTVEVMGHDSLENIMYAPNTIVNVQDELTQVFEELWVAGVTYKYQEGKGATTELRCWRKGTYQIGPV